MSESESESSVCFLARFLAGERRVRGFVRESRVESAGELRTLSWPAKPIFRGAVSQSVAEARTARTRSTARLSTVRCNLSTQPRTSLIFNFEFLPRRPERQREFGSLVSSVDSIIAYIIAKVRDYRRRLCIDRSLFESRS